MHRLRCALSKDMGVVCFYREETLAGVTEKGPLRLCCRGEWDHPSSGKNQGKLRTNQPQLTPAQDDGQKRKFSVPRLVTTKPGSFFRTYLEHMMLLTLRLAQALLSAFQGFAQAGLPLLNLLLPIFAWLRRSLPYLLQLQPRGPELV